MKPLRGLYSFINHITSIDETPLGFRIHIEHVKPRSGFINTGKNDSIGVIKPRRGSIISLHFHLFLHSH